MGLGRYAASFAVAGTFFIFITAGLGSLIIREIAGHKEKTATDIVSLLGLNGIFGLLLLGLVGCSVRFMPALHDIRNIIIVLLFSGLIDAVTQVFSSVFIAYEKMRYVMNCSIIKDSVAVGLALAVILHNGGIFGVSLCFLLGSLVGLAYSLFAAHAFGIRPSCGPRWRIMSSYLKKGLFFFAGTLFSHMLLRIDIIMLKIFQGNYVVGLYRGASSFLMNIEAFPYLFTLTLYPMFSRLFKTDKAFVIDMYRRSFVTLLAINILLLLTVFLFAKRLVLLIFGSDFADSVIILRYAVFIVVFLFQNYLNVHLLNAANKEKLNAFILGAAVALNILLDCLLIPRYSYYGVLVAMFVTYVFLFVFLSWAVRRVIYREKLLS